MATRTRAAYNKNPETTKPSQVFSDRKIQPIEPNFLWLLKFNKRYVFNENSSKLYSFCGSQFKRLFEIQCLILGIL